MSFEKKQNEKPRKDKNETLVEMTIMHHKMMGMGRQDWEISPALLLLDQVIRDEITPEEGVARMQGILDSKQEH
jgi:hypothetical protein